MSISPAKTLETAAFTLDALQVEYDRNTLIHNPKTNEVVAFDTGGDHVIGVTFDDYPRPMKRSALVDRGQEPYTFNGFFVDEKGLLHTSTQRRLFKTGHTHASVERLSSPKRLNLAQEALGRSLGRGGDAFKFSTIPNTGEIPLRLWLEAISRKEAPLADPYASFRDFEHDSRIGGHALGYLHSNGPAADRIADSMTALVDMYGEKMDLPKGLRPEIIDSYADAAESLSSHILEMFTDVINVATAAENLDQTTLDLRTTHLRTAAQPAHYIGHPERQKLYTDYRHLGLAERAWRAGGSEESISAVHRDYLSRIAANLLSIDQQWPRNLTDEQHEARHATLTSIATLSILS